MSKRVRSSLSDGRLEGRGSVPTGQGPLANSDKTSPLEKEKTCARPSVTVSGLSEDKIRGLSTGGEGCEKNLKRKRSLGTMLNRGNDADRDVKPTGQRSSANEARPGPSDGLAFRYRASAGAVAGSKMDSSSQQNNIGSHVLSKIDVDYATLPNERRVWHAGLEKEDAMIKETRYILQIEAQVPRRTPKHAGHQEPVHLSWAHLLPSNVQLQEAMKHLTQIKPHL